MYRSTRRALAVLAACASLALHAQPLTPDEFGAVLAEVEAMVKTNENDVTRFVVQQATPQRIERFYETPQLATQRKRLRENGLIFGGLGGKLLAFDRPADVLAKMERWFPTEMAEWRAERGDGIRGPYLFGPYTNWQAEPTAFMILWKCLPRSAWVYPDRHPFARALNDFHLMHPLGGGDPGGRNLSLGYCARENAGYRPPRTEAEVPAAHAQARAMGELAAPVLVDRFDRVLQAQGCRGTGPEDCVLLLNAWASLRPDDPVLARRIQELEAQVAPDATLPPLRRPVDPADSEATADDTQDQFDAGLRIGGFLQAKVRSVLAQPEGWPEDALARTFAQVSDLRRRMALAYAVRWRWWALDENPLSNPWLALKEAIATPRVRDAVFRHLDALGSDPECAVHATWFAAGDAALQTEYVLRQLSARERVRCGEVDWAALRAGATQAARDAARGFLELLPQAAGYDREAMLSEATGGGEACFERPFTGGAWLRALCDRWISRPGTVTAREARAARAKAWHLVRTAPLPQPEENVEVPRETDLALQTAWLMQLAPRETTALRDALHALGADFASKRIWISSASRWTAPGGRQSLVLLRMVEGPFASGGTWPLGKRRVLLRLYAERVELVGIPDRFSYQYDDGDIFMVTDIDADGNPEVWFSGTFGECDDPEAKPGVDCAMESVYLSEVNGDTLTWYHRKR